MAHQPLPLNRIYLAHALSEPAFGARPDEIFYVRMADGKRSVIRQSLVTGLAQIVNTAPLPAGSVGYGGGIFAVHGDLLVYAAKGGSLVGLHLGIGAQWPVSPSYEGVGAPAISPCGRFVAFLAEQGGRCNVLLVDIRAKHLPIKLTQDPWYAFNPTFAPDGSRLAWMEWDEQDMPWDATRLVVARFKQPTHAVAEPYALLPLATHTLARPNTSFSSPQFSPPLPDADGRPACQLAFVSDESGWRSLWVGDADGQGAVRIETGPGEIGGPDWVPGLWRIRWDPRGGSIFALRRHEAKDTLLEIGWPGRAVREVAQPFTTLQGLTVARAGNQGTRLAFVGHGSATPGTLVTLDNGADAWTARATGAIGILDQAALSTPEVVAWPTTDGTVVHGVFYPAVAPAAGDGAGATAGPRPLIVQIHGGPTSEVTVNWDPQAQYFATRGWHYLCVNHRGSTGYGRAFQELLNGAWGVVDVEDARTGAQALVDRGLADRKRLVVTGGSAGGYTTLMALTQDPDFWAAGVSLYGIGNLYDLKLGSHRFEVNYETGSLLGPLPETAELWKARSPLTHVERVRAPILLFHGMDDKAVPVQQSIDFEAAVTRRGGIAELVTYPDEGHGFVKEATRRDLVERMERFLEKVVVCLQA